jgi:spore coat protein CotH
VPSSMGQRVYCGRHVLDELRDPQGAKLRLMRTLARQALAATTLLSIVAAFMVTSHAQGQLPPGGAAAPFDLDAIFQERAILAQFDTSKNGRLERAERQAAREWLAKQPPSGLAAVAGRFAGPGGGPPGPPAGFGGRGFATGSPGQRLAPDAVRIYRDEPFYDPTVLRTLFLQFENADWEKELADFYNTDVDVPALLTVDGRQYRDVGVRFRGMSSFAFVGEGSKRSLNVAIDFADDDQRVMGFRTLNLLNANSDPTFVRALLYSHIARQYMPAARINYARVVINGESWGIYLNAEQFNSDFVRDRFKDKGGARWKVPGSPIGRGGMAYLGDSIEAYRGIYDIKSRDNEQSWRRLIQMFKVLNETPAERLEAELSPLLDIDGALKFLAVEIALANTDGYWTRASDYNIYLDAQGRVHVLPHDMNEGLEEEGGGPGGPGGRGRGGPPGGPGGFQLPPGIQLPPGFQFPMTFGQAGAELDPLVGLDDTSKPLRSKLLAVPALRTRYLGYLREIADKWLDWRTLEPLVRQYQAVIAADVKLDTRKLYPTEQFTAGVDQGNSSIKSFVERRRAFLLKTIR